MEKLKCNNYLTIFTLGKINEKVIYKSSSQIINQFHVSLIFKTLEKICQRKRNDVW